MGWKYTYAYLVPDEPFVLTDLGSDEFMDLTRPAREWAIWDKAHFDRVHNYIEENQGKGEARSDGFKAIMDERPDDEVTALYGREQHGQELGLFLLIFREFRGSLTMWGTGMRGWGNDAFYALGALHSVGFRGEVWRVQGHQRITRYAPQAQHPDTPSAYWETEHPQWT